MTPPEDRLRTAAKAVVAESSFKEDGTPGAYPSIAAIVELRAALSPANVSTTGHTCELHHVHSETEPCSAVIDRWDAAEPEPDERFVRLATAVLQLRDFLALHRKAKGRSDVNIRKVLKLLDDALRDHAGQPDGERITDARGDELEHGEPDYPGQFVETPRERAAREKRDANP